MAQYPPGIASWTSGSNLYFAMTSKYEKGVQISGFGETENPDSSLQRGFDLMLKPLKDEAEEGRPDVVFFENGDCTGKS